MKHLFFKKKNTADDLLAADFLRKNSYRRVTSKEATIGSQRIGQFDHNDDHHLDSIRNTRITSAYRLLSHLAASSYSLLRDSKVE